MKNNRLHRLMDLRNLSPLLIILSFLFLNSQLAFGQCNAVAGCINGNVFEDYNFDGIENSSEFGVANINVDIYDISNTLLSSIVTDANGDWQLCNLVDGQNYRVEFHIPTTLSWLQPTNNGVDNGTDVQFIKAPDCAVFSVSSSSNYCQENPHVGLACYGNGDPSVPANGVYESFVTFPYDASSSNASTHTAAPVQQANVEDIGSVWGTAYQPHSNTMFASAVMRRFAGFGPLSTGGIYKFDFSNPSNPLPGTFNYNYIDVKTIGIPTGADTRNPADPCNSLALNPTDPTHDIDAYEAVGTIGIGDIDYDPINNTLWLINLNDGKLYGIQNIDPNTTPVAADVVGGILVPLPAGYSCQGEIRPWGVTYHQGMIYVGSVCDSHLDFSLTDLRGFIMKIDPNNLAAGFSLVTDVDLSYTLGNYGPTATNNWTAWRSLAQGQVNPFLSEPLIADIEFDADGSIILAVMNRSGLQCGHTTYNIPDCSRTSTSDAAMYSDILRLCYDGANYIQDSDAGCTTASNAVSIPNTDEYYWGEHGPASGKTNAFNEIAIGGLALLPGSNQVLANIFDPVEFHSGGMMTLDNTTGGDVNRYQVYLTGSGPSQSFGKTTGLGEPELICDAAPLEIGNYVWNDLNQNGIQDANEPGVNNMIVQLYDTTGVLIGQTVTTNGTYYFNQANVDLTGVTIDGSGNVIPNNNFGPIDYNNQYFVVFGDSQYANSSYLIGSNVYGGNTLFDVNSNVNNNIDSDVDGSNLTAGSLGARPDGLPFIEVNTTIGAFQPHLFDMGILPEVELFTIGNYVWLDEDGDGDQDAGESGIPGIGVSLFDINNVLLETVYTDFDGGYIFENVPEGDYTITVISWTSGLQNQTADPDVILDHSATISLTEDNLAIDFGYNYAPPSDTNNPSGATGAIGDRVWSDANSDGIQDIGEPGIGNVIVNLLDDSGTVIAATTTDPSGYYVFDNLPAGVYSIEIDDTTIPTGFITAPTGDPDGDGDNISEQIVLAPGDVYLDMDFGYNNPTSYNIGDQLFVDVNANGVEDAGELPIAGVTVTLIEDTNGNGIWDVGELPIANSITDATGAYLFSGLLDGDYVVVITDTGNVTTGMANSADPDGGLDEYSAVTIAGADDLMQDFGYIPEGHTNTDGIIGDFIFLDSNSDDTQTLGEPGIENVKVELYDSANMLVATNYTNPNGMYLFGGLPADTYTIKVDDTTLPSAASIPSGLTQSIDPDGGNDNESIVTIATGGQDLDQDFGYKALTPNTITGTIWEDIDANGTLDETTPNLFENVTVEIRDDQGNLMGTTSTDTNGDFTFEGLPDGTYFIDVTDINQIISDYWKSNGLNLGVDNNSQDDVNTVTLIGGTTDNTSDFGYYEAGAALGNYVWEDTNLDGIQDPSEPGLAGVLVTLEITYPDGTVITITDITDVNGHYNFDNLLLDEDYNTGGGGLMPTFEISAMAPSGFVATIVDANANGNDQEDSEDPTGTIAIPIQGQKNTVSNINPNIEALIASYDFGFGLDQRYDIGNFVWLDEDGDGNQDAGEIGIGGVPVNLYDASGTLLETVMTDFNGGYLFENYPVGPYTIIIDDTQLPIGLQNQTYDHDGVLDHQSTGLLLSENDLGQDFGYNYASPTDTNNPAGALGAIGDRVWSDANGNGLQDPSEVGIGGVAVNLLDDAGAVIATTITDPSGYYIFDDLVASTYAIQIDIATLPAGFTTAPTGDPDGDNTNTSEPIPLAPGDVYMNMDFGYNDPNAYNLGDRIYLDANVSGLEDAGELPIPNVSVALIEDTNGNGMWDLGELPIATDITDANGNYLFTGLGNGNYVVIVTNSNNVLNGLTNTADPDGGLNDYSGVTIAGADDLMQDFGYAPEGHAVGDGIIGDLVFLDADGNGAYNAGDSGLEGIGVILYNSAGVFLGSTTTDLNGKYLFGGLPADIYTVEIGSASIPVGLTNNVDPDGGNDGVSNTKITIGGQDLLQDFGYQALIPNTVSGTIWEDRDAEGDLDETIYFAGVTVVLTDANGNVIGTTVTDANGNYEFTGLPDGTFTFEVTDDANILNGHWLTDGANDGANNNSQPSSYSVSVAGGTTNDTGDFGYYIDGAALGNFVWVDINEDGMQGPGETGLAGVVITLEITYPDGTTTTMTDITDIDGHYSFDNLLLDEDYNIGNGGSNPSYVIFATAPTGYQPTLIGIGTAGQDSDDPAGTAAIPFQGQMNTMANPVSTLEEVIAFYDFGFQPIPLPVILIKFEVVANECNALLSWESASEKDFSHYIVEKSTDGSKFEFLTTVQGKERDGTKQYQYTDAYVTGKAFYRLKMLDLDGSYEFSRVITGQTDCSNDISGIQLYPNPIGTDLTTLNMNFTSKSEAVAWVVISDKLGREQLKFPIPMNEGDNALGIDISNLAAGIYSLSISPETGKMVTKQFVKIQE